jgi:hypothetical protein
VIKWIDYGISRDQFALVNLEVHIDTDSLVIQIGLIRRLIWLEVAW